MTQIDYSDFSGIILKVMNNQNSLFDSCFQKQHDKIELPASAQKVMRVLRK